jgi:hypothetical protein
MRATLRVVDLSGFFAAFVATAFLAGCAMGTVGCDSAKEKALNDACDAKSGPVVTACLSAADFNKQCAATSTGTMHYLFLEMEGAQLGMAGSMKGGKAGERLAEQAVGIYQSIADDPKAPLAAKMMARKVVAEHRQWQQAHARQR